MLEDLLLFWLSLLRITSLCETAVFLHAAFALRAASAGTGALAAVGGVGLAGFGAADGVCLADFGTVGATGFGAADGVGLGLGSLELLAPPEVCAAGCAPPRRTCTGCATSQTHHLDGCSFGGGEGAVTWLDAHKLSTL